MGMERIQRGNNVGENFGVRLGSLRGEDHSAVFRMHSRNQPANRCF